MFNVGRNLDANLPKGDMGRAHVNFPASVQALYDRGQLGRKTGGGFYKLTRHDDGSKTMEVYDLLDDAWRDARKPALSESENTLEELWNSDSANGRFTTELMANTLFYSASLVPEIADDIVNVDRAMRWGFGWGKGPFQLIDQLGAKNVADALRSMGMEVPTLLSSLITSGADNFYRNDGTEYFGVDGNWHKVENE